MEIDTRYYFESMQKGLPAAKQIFTGIDALCATNPYELAQSTEQFLKSRKLGPQLFDFDKTFLQIAARKFHEKAGTLTKAVQENINLLATDAPIFRFAFTPYHFAYTGVYTQFIFLNMATESYTKSTNHKACQLYFNIEGDIAEDKKLCTSYVPDIDYMGGSMHIKMSISLFEKYYPVRSIRKPSEITVTQWINILRTNIFHNFAILRRAGIPSSAKNRFLSNIQLIEDEIKEAYTRADTLSEFNSIFLSRIINLHWNIPTAFVSTTDISIVMSGCYEYLMSEYPKLVETSNVVVEQLQAHNIDINNNLRMSMENFPFWYYCDKCSSRTQLTIQSVRKLLVAGRCPTCNKYYHFHLGTINQPDLSKLFGKISPKVLMDELTDIVGWRIAGGVDYLGGLNHTLVNSLIAVNLGLELPPGCLWRPRGIYFGLAESRYIIASDKREASSSSVKTEKALERVYFGRASILYCLLAQGTKELYNMWKSHFESGKQTYELSVGARFIEFSNAQERRLRHKLAEIEKSGNRQK